MSQIISPETEGAEIDEPKLTRADAKEFLDLVPAEGLGFHYAYARMRDMERFDIITYMQVLEAKYGGPINVYNGTLEVRDFAGERNVSVRDLQAALVSYIEGAEVESDVDKVECVDVETSYFLDRLGLDVNLRNAIVNAINELESKRKQYQESGEGSFEVAQFLEVVRLELSLRAKDAMNERVRGRLYVKIGKLIEKIGRQVYRTVQHKQHLGGLQCSEVLRSKISPANWAELLTQLGITEISDDGFQFSASEPRDLLLAEFETGRAAAFLNPYERRCVQNDAERNPELALVMRSLGGSFRRRPSADVVKSSTDGQRSAVSDVLS